MAFTSVKLSVDSNSYTQQMKSAAAQMRVLSAEYSTAATKAKLFGSATDGLKAKAESLTQKISLQKNIVQLNSEQQEKLTKKLTDQKSKQEELKSKIDEARIAYEKSTEETGKNSEQSKALKNELNSLEQQYKVNESAIGKTETALANQTVKTEKSKTALMGMEKELENVNKELKEHKFNAFTEGCTKAGTAIEKVGKKLSVMSAATVAAGTASAKMAVDFEDDMAKVSTIMDTNEMSLEDMQDAIIDLSNKTGIAVGDVADDVYNAISAGQKTGDAVAFVENSTKLATAGFAESGDTLNILTTILNAYGLKAEEVTNVSDMLIQTQNLGKTTVAELSSAMGKVIPTANANHVALDQLCSGYAIMTANGVATAESTTYMNSMLNELGKTGSTTDVILRKKTGKSFSELMKGGASLADVLKIVQDAAKEDNKSMNDMFSSSEAAKAGMILLGDGTKKFNTTLKQMQKSTGSTDKAFNKMKTTSHSAKIAVNEMKNSALKLGTTMLNSASPAIEKGTKKIHELTNKFNSLNEKQQQTVIKVGLVTAAIGPATVATGKLVKGVGDTVKGVKKGIEYGGKAVSAVKKVAAKIIEKTAATAAGTTADTAATAATAAHTTATAAATATTGTMTAAQTALNVAMKLCPILMIVGLITGLIAAGVALYKNWDKISAFGTKLWGNIKKDFNNIKKNVTESFKKSGEAVENNVKKMTNSVKNSAIGKATSTVFKAIHKTVENNMKASAASAKKNLDEMKSAYKKNGGGIKGIVAATMTGIRNHYKSKYDEINKLTGGKLDIMVQKTREGFKKAAKSIAEKVSQARKNASSFATGIVTEVGKIPGKVKTVGINLVKGLWNGISNMQSWVISKVRGFGSSVLTGLKNFFGIHSPSKVMEEQIGKNLALGVANGITKHKKHAKKSASEMGSEIVKAAKKKLDTYKTYHKMSLKQETEYWDTVRKQIKKGTSARTEADKKYLADKKSLNSQLTKAQKEYAKSEKQINADLKKEIKNLTNEYKNAVKERKNSLLSSFSLFESYDAGDAVSKSDLLVGMQTQVEALNEWERQIADLKTRMGNTSLYKTIQEMGVSGLQQVKALNSMTDEELKRYESLYKERQTSAKTQATTELQDKKKSTDEKIAKASEDAEKKLDKAQKTYTDACKKLGVTGAAAVKKTVEGAEKPLTKSLAKIQKNTKKTISTAVSTTKKGATQLKRAMDFKWSLPKLKMPHISVSSGKTPYGIGGKGSVPKFKVDYYKTGGIMTNPTVFGLNGNSWMVGGEAGAEAILPLQEFYQKFSSILDRKFEAVQKAQAVGVTCYTYIDGDEIASRTVTKVDSKMVTDKRKRR